MLSDRCRKSSEFFESLESRQLLATFTVTSAADAGAGTLRQAVLDANANAEADVIEFDASMRSQVVVLATGQITISSPLTIRGTDSTGAHLGVSISGNNQSRIFDINDNNGASLVPVSISDLWLTSGRAAPSNAADGGGGIRNAESLTLERVAMVNHTVASLGQGGALLNMGTVTITGSTFTNNHVSGNGGAVFNLTALPAPASMTIVNSTFNANTATQAGGAIFQQSSGRSASLTVLNSTIIRNIADSDNTGEADHVAGGIGLYSTNSTLLLRSTIVSNNTRFLNGAPTPDELNLRDGGALLPASSHNLILDPGTAGGLVDGVGDNIVGHNPLLRPMARAGGVTATAPLSPGSPAIDKGVNPNGLTTDQRGGGFARENGGAVDIGAFETQTISFVVDSAGALDDIVYGPGQLTLIEALTMTNANPGADTITFDPSLSGSTIQLAGANGFASLFITDDLTLTGPGASNLTIDGGGNGGVFRVDDFNFGTTLQVSVSGLRLTNANATQGGAFDNYETLSLAGMALEGNMSVNNGGAIMNQFGATLTVTDSTISGNQAGLSGGAIDNMGTLTIARTQLNNNTSLDNANGNGGAVQNQFGATLTIADSTLRGNTGVANGGAIENNGIATVSRSVLADNASTAAGGAIDNFGGVLTISRSTLSGNTTGGSGGAIWTDTTLTIDTCTISGNSAADFGGGIGMFDGTVVVSNSTIAFNRAETNDDAIGQGGGIDVGKQMLAGTLTTTSTIFAGNTSGTANPVADDISLTNGSVSGENNLVQDAGTAGGLTDGAGGNIVGKDPLLAPLAANGGMFQTHALLEGSPAIDKGAALSNVQNDQRGLIFARFSGAGADIGAYERQKLTLVVDSVADNDDLDFSAGQLTLREAIAASNANPVDDEISFAASLDKKTIVIGRPSLTISDDVTITGPGVNSLTIDGGGNSRIFTVTDGNAATTIVVSISGLRLTGGSAVNGGAIDNFENLTLTGVTLADNVATNDGGAIRNQGTLTIADSKLLRNMAADSGGAIDNDGATTTTITNTSIRQNAAGGAAGAIDNDAAGTLTIEGSVLSSNTAGASGGAIDNAGTLTITDSRLTGNSSTDSVNGFGGAIQNQAGGTLRIANSTLSGNSGVSGGGAIENNGTATITDSTLTDNSAADSGGAIDNFGGTLTLVGSTLSGNSTGGSGGAIWTDTALTVQSSTISGNSAGDFGGGIGMFDGTVVVSNSTLAFNVADANDDGTGQGGAIDVGNRNGPGTLTTTSSIYAGNTRGAAAPVADDISLTDGTVAGTNNLVQDAGTAGGLEHGVNGNLVGVDPRLAALADNGGATMTHAIYPGSPVIDGGIASGGVESDQRGLTRTHGRGVDIGAYEWSPTVFSLDAVPATRASASSDNDDTHTVQVRNVHGDLIVYRGSGKVWQVMRLRDYTDAPAATGDAVIFTDPADGLTYIAGPSEGGFLLFRLAADGTWSYRNLTTELGVGADTPADRLTQFTTQTGLVSIAGYTASGEIVLFQQTGEAGDSGAVWLFDNLSDDLAAAGKATPDLREITSYVTPWDQWTIAGVDVNGDIQGVWVFKQGFEAWTTNNLSDLFGTPTVTGQLTVIQTAWNAINISASDENGNLVVTWWIPRFKAKWAVNNLTEEFSGTALANGRITGFVTPWGAMNYVGLDNSGELIAYWWTPKTRWVVSTLTRRLPDTQERPTGTITGHVSVNGTMSVLGTADDGGVTRLSWSVADNEWLLSDLTDLAVRV